GPEIFKLLGISAEIRFGSIEQMASQMAEGKLDGVVIPAGFPIPALAELDARQQIDFVQPSSEQNSMVRNKMPEISLSLIPSGTYRSLTRNYHTIGVYNFAIAHKDLSDEFIGKLVKVVFDNHEELMKSQSSAKETIPENIDRNTMLPLHPGALRYYREAGIAVPPGAVVGNRQDKIDPPTSDDDTRAGPPRPPPTSSIRASERLQENDRNIPCRTCASNCGCSCRRGSLRGCPRGRADHHRDSVAGRTLSGLWSGPSSHSVPRVGTRGHRTVNSRPGAEHHAA